MEPETLSIDDARYNRMVPRLFVLFFLVIIVVNGVFLYFAQSSHTGVVRKDAYQVGLDYNSVIAAADNVKNLGWEPALAVDADRLIFDLADSDGEAVKGALVRARLKRPVAGGLDFEVPFVETGSGRYIWDGAGVWPARGQWDVILDVIWQEQTFQMKQRIVLK